MTDRDRLIELFNEIEKDPAITCPAYKTDKTCKDCKYTINEAMCNHTERKVDYLLANGVIVPPCKVGDTVWFLCEDEDEPNGYFISDNIVTEVGTKIFAVSAYDPPQNDITEFERYENIGKTVFLTKEDAEQALKERG